jgi:tRNA pseudouridine55 synthase
MSKRRPGRPLHGWLVLDKPLGLSSSQAVGRVKRLTGAEKAGHGGTLDPLASGILPVALGEATKTVQWAMNGRKTYRFTLRWGEARATDDAEGEVVATSSLRPEWAEIEAVLPRFLGRIRQTPPHFSAIKVEGKRAYALARAAQPLELAPREVEIFALRLLGTPDADHAEFLAEVAKGTYIRALGRDLGAALGTCAYVAALRRTAVGRFTEAQAIGLDKLEQIGQVPALFTYLLPIETALDDIPALALSEAEAARLRHGQAIALARAGERDLTQGELVCAMSGGRPVALAEVQGEQLRPVRVLNT